MLEIDVRAASGVVFVRLVLHELVCVHKVHLVVDFVGRPRCAEAYLRLAFHSLLGVDDNHSVGSPGSVYRCRGCILEDIDGLYVSRVERQGHRAF